LLQYPVLSDLARQISRPAQSHGNTSAIPVRRTGTRDPIFFVPSGEGDHAYVFELAKEIDENYPIYALPWQADQVQLKTLETMAAPMVRMVQKIQPHGPYRLAGFSSGGVLTYAIAEHLLGLDEVVSSLYLIDVYHPLLFTQSPRSAKQILFDQVFYKYESVGDITAALATLQEQAEDLTLQELIIGLQKIGVLSETFDVEHRARRLEQMYHYDVAMRAYQMIKLPITIYQFYASDPMAHHDANVPFLPSRGWEQTLPAESICCFPIPGNHTTMMKDASHRATLGRNISAVLQENSAPRL